MEMALIAMDNPVRRRVLNGEISVGTWCINGNALTTETLGYCGFDWILIDVEHFPTDLPQCTECIRAAETAGVVPMVRLASADPVAIKQYLDAGAMGLVIRQIRSAQDARDIVTWSRFRPLGKRPFGRGRVGLRYQNYLRDANNHILILPQIETKDAVEQLDEILEVKGCDGFLVGPTDLSMDFGWPTPAEGNHAEREQLVADLGRRIRAAGKVAATLSASAEQLMQRVDAGFNMVSLLSDLFMIQQFAQTELKNVNDALERRG